MLPWRTKSDPSATTYHPPRMWIVVVASIFLPGLGHLYAGSPRRGVAMWLLANAVDILSTRVPLPLAPPWNIVPLLLPFFLPISFHILVAWDAYRVSRSLAHLPRRPMDRRYVLFYASILLVAVIGRAFGDRTMLRDTCVRAFTVPSPAMSPTILAGDYLFADMCAYAPRQLPARGDVVVHRIFTPGTLFAPETDYIKRVVAVAGDILEIRNRHLFINFLEVDEPFVQFIDPNHRVAIRDDYGPVVVPPESFFVMGDNRDKSYDSRFLGFVHVLDLRGRVLSVYYSTDGSKVRWNRIGKTIE